VTEIVEITPELRQLISSSSGNLSMLREKTSGPLSSLSQALALRVISGDTSAREAARVAGQRFWNELAEHSGRPAPAGGISATVDNAETEVGVGVLLFHTDSAERGVWATAIEKLGLEVYATDDIESARGLVEKNENIVLLIVNLQTGKSGDNHLALARLRRALAWSRLPVLLVVPESDKVLEDILHERGVSDYLVQPVTAEAVSARVQAMLAR
jgi:CheY-like chemotaxis protein